MNFFVYIAILLIAVFSSASIWLVGTYYVTNFLNRILVSIVLIGTVVVPALWILARRWLTNRNEILLKQLQTYVDTINQLESKWQTLSDSALRAKTDEFRERLKKNSLKSLIPEAFATVREASRRTLNMRHFDVQLIGGLVLHEGKIAEMRTGEGKTLVATLPVYLNALTGQGVHVVTVNDYLAKRDAEWMKPVYEFLGLSVGVVQAALTPPERQKAYAADVTYGTNNEFGFDYLRDNMVLSPSERVQRGLHYALVDEVDSILIDEARTPLIISGASEEDLAHFTVIDQVVTRLKPGEEADFIVDEKARQVYLTEEGHQHLEEQFVKIGLFTQDDNPYSTEHVSLMYHVTASLQARYLYKRDVDYIVQANQIVIVDEHTGRLMPGRRWGGGVHQALEAKEKLAIQPENQTLARITFQNYFRLYYKLCGMTGTADTEAYELNKIYNLEVIVIPTYKPVRRNDLPDKIYLSLNEKWQAIALAVESCWKRQQPVLIGTASIEHSELVSRLLQKRGIPHQVLNAKRHEREANIIVEAGRPKAVTIATNMAGRGTDIVLGGNLQAELEALNSSGADVTASHQAAWRERYEQVVKTGGLHIIGSSRHESRRIDNQLRGRAGRQGDPGSSQFYLSFEDNLLRIFAADRLATLTKFMQRLGMKPGESIEHPWISNSIQSAQRKVEEHQFDIRKELLEYDDVMNEQRTIIYQQRRHILEADSIAEIIQPLWQLVFEAVIADHFAYHKLSDENRLSDFLRLLETEFCLFLTREDLSNISDRISLSSHIATLALDNYQTKESRLGAELRRFEKMVMLETLDKLWREHLSTMDQLRQQVRLRGFAQQNPKEEYKREAFELFKQLLENLKYLVIQKLSCLDSSQLFEMTAPLDALPLQDYPMVSRNAICPCGSGKKFKYCHGQLN